MERDVFESKESSFLLNAKAALPRHVISSIQWFEVAAFYYWPELVL